MIGKSKPGMKFCQLNRKRNLTHLDIQILCNILDDSEFNFCYTLETTALKK